jgi:5'-nucleotidase
LVGKKNYAETVYHDPIEVAQHYADFLRNEKNDLVICLSHIGFDYKDQPEKMSDKHLAAKLPE